MNKFNVGKQSQQARPAAQRVITESEARGAAKVAFDSIRTALMKKHGNMTTVNQILAGVVAQPDVLDLEYQLNPNNAQYVLAIRQDTNADGSPTALRRGLDQNDVAYVRGLRIGIRKHLSTVATGPFKGGNSDVYTYVEDAEFEGANEAFALTNVYNAELVLQTAAVSRLKVPTSNLRYVPQTQIMTATTAGTGTRTSAQFGGAGSESRGFFQTGAQIILDGKDDNKLTFRFLDPVSTTNIDGSATTVTRGSGTYYAKNYLVVSLEVFRFVGLAQGANLFL